MTDGTADRTADGTGLAGGLPAAGGRGSSAARIAMRLGLAALRRLKVGAIEVVLPDGSTRTFGDPESNLRGVIHVHDERMFLRFLVGGETGGGEAYMEGLWSSPDLAALVRVAAYNRGALDLAAGWWRVPAQLRRTAAHRARRNTRRNARRNIAAH